MIKVNQEFLQVVDDELKPTLITIKNEKKNKIKFL
jgi:hypothetical protein